jgi:hypothetical protein
MKRTLSIIVVAAAILGLAGCGTLRDAVGGAISQGISQGIRTEAAPKENPKADVTPEVEFKADEILSTTDEGKMMDNRYWLARVLTPASSATKNQSEVLFVGDGSKAWSPWIITSRKSVKEDFKVGAILLVPGGWDDHDNVSGESYRRADWYLRRVTSTDDLFKNRVSVGGYSFNVAYLRTPTVKIQE